MSKYNKGDKFIIELDEQVGDLWKIKGFNALVFDDQSGNLRQCRLYSLQELIALGETFIEKK